MGVLSEKEGVGEKMEGGGLERGWKGWGWEGGGWEGWGWVANFDQTCPDSSSPLASCLIPQDQQVLLFDSL